MSTFTRIVPDGERAVNFEQYTCFSYKKTKGQ